MSQLQELNVSGFAPSYAVVIDPEFPGDGDWGCDVFGFGRDGRLEKPFHSVWGTPFVVEVRPASAHRWVGQYAAGGLGGISGAFACPSPDHLCVLVDGQAYLTDVGAPASGSVVAHDQVGQVVASADLLLLVRFIDIVAIGRDGIAWRTKRLAVDDLRVIRATSDVIECSLDNLGGSSEIAIDAATGEQIEGTRLDSFWPPDVLA